MPDNCVDKTVRAMEGVLDATPVIGHVKGIVHGIRGDHEAAERAFTAATRTSAVVGAGVGGMLVSGPVTGAAIAATTGVGWDTATAIVTEGEETPGASALIADPCLETAAKAGVSLVSDSFAGLAGPKMIEQVGRRMMVEASITTPLKEMLIQKFSSSDSGTKVDAPRTKVCSDLKNSTKESGSS